VSEVIEDQAATARSIHPGAMLRQGRESRGLSVDDVAQALKLTPKQVVAIESEEFDILPGNTFARGFVRNYARFLQFDPAPLMAALERQLAHAEVDLSPVSNAGGTMPTGFASRGVPKVVWMFLLIAIAALVAVVYLDRLRPQTAPTEAASGAAAVAPAPPAPAVAETASGEAATKDQAGAAAAVPVVPAQVIPAAPSEVPAPASAVAPAAQPAPAAAPADSAAAAQAMRRLEFSFARESWVQVRDGSGKVLLSNNNPAGSSRVVDGVPPFSLIVGNAPAVTLTYDDRPVDLKPHTASTVARLKLD
jgi:cytoskeleton protein RodZ